MPLLYTPEVARDVARIIREHHAAVAAAVFGEIAVAPEDWELAVRLGLVDPTAPPTGIMEQLHVFGAYLAHAKQAEERGGLENMSAAEFTGWVAKHPIPRTEQEVRAARFSAARGAEYVVGLGNRVGAQVGTSLIEDDHELDRRLRGLMRDAVSAKLGDPAAAQRLRDAGAEDGLGPTFFEDEFRASVRRTASNIGHATGDWARDVQRIAHTETHRAVEEGIKESWQAQEDSKPPAQRKPILVYKLPRPSACKDCVRLHLDAGAPRIFDLADLQANGTNVGVPRASWQAVVGPTHPWCACSLHRVPSLVTMPPGWKSGDAAPSVIGPGGTLVLPGGTP